MHNGWVNGWGRRVRHPGHAGRAYVQKRHDPTLRPAQALAHALLARCKVAEGQGTGRLTLRSVCVTRLGGGLARGSLSCHCALTSHWLLLSWQLWSSGSTERTEVYCARNVRIASVLRLPSSLPLALLSLWLYGTPDSAQRHTGWVNITDTSISQHVANIVNEVVCQSQVSQSAVGSVNGSESKLSRAHTLFVCTHANKAAAAAAAAGQRVHRPRRAALSHNQIQQASRTLSTHPTSHTPPGKRKQHTKPVWRPRLTQYVTNKFHKRPAFSPRSWACADKARCVIHTLPAAETPPFDFQT